MRKLLLCIVVVSTTIVAYPPSLLSLCAGLSFEQQIQNAELIFAGTLRSAEAVRHSHTIVTRYRFDHVRYVKGRASVDSLVLIQDGGTV